MIIPENSVLWWSGKGNSTRLLKALRKSKQKFDIVQIRDFWTREQRKEADALILKWKLKVFMYRPSDRYFLDENTFVSEYAVTGGRLPLLTSTEHGDGCIADLYTQRIENPPFTWTTHLLGNAEVEKREVNGITFWCPLGISPSSPETIKCCSQCLRRDVNTVWCHKEQQAIPTIKWDSGLNNSHYKRLLQESAVCDPLIAM